MTPTNFDPQQLGRHEAKLEHLEKMMDQMSGDVQAIRKAMDEIHGGWKVAVWVSGPVGAVVTLVLSHLLGGRS